MIFDQAKGRKWDPGMELPKGGAHKLRVKPEDIEKFPRDGEGTLENPMVIWAARLTEEQRNELRIPEFEDEEDLYRAVDANTDMAKTVAVRCGCTVVWIICPVHKSKYAYENGEKVPTNWDNAGNPKEYLVVDADPHLTIRLGTDEDACLLHGHINVNVDERGFPTTFMTKFQRHCEGHVTDGDERPFELFEWTEESSAEEHHRQANADYELFKAMTMREEGWESEDLGKSDTDYKPPDHLEAMLKSDAQYVPVVDEREHSDPEYDNYIVRRWNPYRTDPAKPRHEKSILTYNFGYNVRQFKSRLGGLSRYVHYRTQALWN
ncbi:uncharacterized protein F4812DRAFT_456920 [Daldinia caldariorum]|uniref:uncharacterized protein n=1 Tax=Daldinia caldariorum TaxID=326644 RepID=UPI002008223E|nr:uncharacterized protein F4812DRAFT_456920 [Daldinia caldariorum]KAI1470910.1 hypothetical protein F4812DRAFT_456920 [Daldinia caldariorum]